MGKLNVGGTEIQVLQIEEDDYISLTDMVRKIDNGPALIEKWLRNKNTIEFLGIWEEMYNEDFDTNAYDEIMQEAGLNRFIMSVKQWVTRTNSKGIVAKAGRYGGTYAYKDIAFEFASWVSPQFKLYLIKEFERLKKEEQALFGMTAKEWRENYPDKKGNIRDYASINELICLSNMENINAVLIEDGLSQKERLIKLNKIAIHQMSILETQTTTLLK